MRSIIHGSISSNVPCSVVTFKTQLSMGKGFLWSLQRSKQTAGSRFLFEAKVFCLLRVDCVLMHLQTDLLILKTVNNSFFK